MAAFTESAALRLHAATSSTTAEAWALTTPVKSLVITNRSPTDLFVTLRTSNTYTADDAGVTVAVAEADETFVIPGVETSGALEGKEIFRSPRASYVSGSIIGSTSSYSVEGKIWY